MLPFLKNNEQKNESYWSVLIDNDWVSASVWEIENNNVKILYTSSSINVQSELSDAIDDSLSLCSQNFPSDFTDPQKTVFGVPLSWVEEGNIKEEYLLSLKKVCQELSLVPAGFVVIGEAVAFYFKSKEQSPFSGLILGINEQAIEFSLFNSGKLISSTVVTRSILISDDLIEGLTRLSPSEENMPYRIVLYNQKIGEVEEIKNNINDIDWTSQENIKFIHPPKIETILPDEKLLAVSLAGGSEIGDVKGVIMADMTANLDTIPESQINNVTSTVDVTPEDLGFVTTPIVSQSYDQNQQQTVEQNYDTQLQTTYSKPKINLPKLKLPTIAFPKIKLTNSRTPMILFVSSVLLLITLFVLWWFVPTAKITIYISPKKIEQQINLDLKNVKSQRAVEVSVNGEKTKSTTGVKVVGEKSKGQVKIQNGTAVSINLPAGTQIISSNDLKFLTTKQASVSAALTPSSPGTTVVDVEANNIGSEFNISKDEIFKVANYPKAEVDATSSADFTGGSSRQITAVADSDKKGVYKDLLAELTEEATEKLNSQLDSESLLLGSSFDFEIENEDYSNKVGDEATTLKLTLDVKFKADVVSKSELNELSRNLLSDKVPSGYVLRDDQLEFKFDSRKDNMIDVNIIANLLPSVDLEDIKKKIAGKYPKVAEDYLKSISGYVNAEFRLPSLLRGKFATLPHVPKNIDITLSSE